MVRRVVLFLAVMVIALFAYQAVRAAALSTISSTDFDNNGQMDLTVFRPSEGKFFVLQSPNRTSAFSIGSSSGTATTDTLVIPGDYNNDGKLDTALYRATTQGTGALAGTWTITAGSAFTASTAYAWGVAADTPLPADWDGNGLIDLAFFRPSEGKLYVLQAPTFNTAFTITWGRGGDIPLPADLDGDGRTDFAVYRPSERLIYVLQQSATGFNSAFTIPFGEATQTFLPGDYDGDGRTDIAVYTPTTLGASNVAGTWTINQGGTGFKSQFAKPFGVAGDIPVPGDWDGDGRLDIAVFRPSENRFFVLQGGSNYTTAFSVPWGAVGDIPIGIRNPVRNTVF